MQKLAKFNFLTSILASGLLLGSYWALRANGQMTGLRLTNMAATVSLIAQSPTYPTIEASAWLDPFANLPVNTPIFVRSGTDAQYLAVISKDSLNPPPQIIEVSTRQRLLVTQWSRNELRAYAYEVRRNGSTLTIDPNPVNQGLHPFARQTRRCGTTTCSVSVSPSVVSSLGTPQQIQVFVGSEQFTLVGRDGIFPIDAALATVLQQATSGIRIITPAGWEASVNQDAVENLRTLYR